MSLLNFNGAPFNDTLIGSTNELISQPNLVTQDGSGKSKKRMSKSKKSTSSKKKTTSSKERSTSSKKKSTSSKKKTTSSKKKTVLKKKVVVKKVSKKRVLDEWTKEKLEKLAKKHGIKLTSKDGKRRTKAQLYRSLKRKSLI